MEIVKKCRKNIKNTLCSVYNYFSHLISNFVIKYVVQENINCSLKCNSKKMQLLLSKKDKAENFYFVILAFIYIEIFLDNEIFCRNEFHVSSLSHY